MEAALEPGRFITDKAGGEFISGLEAVACQLELLIHAEPERATRLYEAFLAGCYEKAEEFDDSSGNLGMFVESLYCGWIKARQAAGGAPDETARWLLARMDDDPYCFTYHLESDAVKVMDKAGLAAFGQQVKARFEAEAPAADGREADHERRRWGEVLRVIYLQQRNIAAYLALCEATELTAQDCLAVATLLKARRRPDEALTWVERGVELDKKRSRGAMVGLELAELRRELLTKVGRGADALEQAWAEFREDPSTSTYAVLMRMVPRSERASWQVKAMAAAESADLDSLIELWLETREIERLVERLRRAGDAELEGLSHYLTEPAARRLAKIHPDVAAKLYRALGMRILNAKKSKYYSAALSNFANAKRCYERAGLKSAWQAVVAEVRGAHQRKVGFLADFNRLVTGKGSREEPSFLDRARSRWPPR